MNRRAPKLLAAHPHWLDDARNVRRLWLGFLVVLALTLVAEWAVTLHPAFAVEGWFGFNAAFGFVACALMILAAKLLGVLLKRPDSYYAGDEEND